jgi:hypothetical protein
MHFQTSGYLPALRDLIYPPDLRIAWRCMDSSACTSYRNATRHHWTLAALTGTVRLRDE